MSNTGFVPSSEAAGVAVVESVGTAARTDHTYVDWPAIFAGALVALAIAFVLDAFGAGLGLTMTGSPWHEGMSAGWFLAAAALWYIWVQISSVMAGGYLAGRMRRRLYDASEHEVDVRNGAHGLFVWAVATVVGAALLAAAAAAGLNVAGKLAGNAVTGASAFAGGASGAGGLDYIVGRLYRPAETGATAAEQTGSPPQSASAETDASDLTPVPATPEAADIARRDTVRIIAAAGLNGQLPDDDRTYIAHLVADTTGLSPDAARKRVDDDLAGALARLRETAEAARKVGIFVAFVTAATLLVSGIAGWWAAGIGGRHRDEGTDLTRWLRIR